MTVVAALEQFVKAVRGHVLVKDAVRAELEKYGSKTVKFNNATFTMKTVGTRYDYNVCNDPVWRELKARQKLPTLPSRSARTCPRYCRSKGSPSWMTPRVKCATYAVLARHRKRGMQ